MGVPDKSLRQRLDHQLIYQFQYRAHFIKQWQDHWSYSYKDSYTYNLVPVVSLDVLLAHLLYYSFPYWL